jgi:hypothetical protein
MKKIMFAALISVCALGAFAVRRSVDVSRHVAVETLSPMAMMQESRTLPSESYDTY